MRWLHIRDRASLLPATILLSTCLSIASVDASTSGHDKCPAFSFATPADMIPPYVAITIDAQGNYAVGAARPTEGSYVVDVEKIPSSQSQRLREEVVSATKDKEPRIFVYADGNSRTQSFVTVLEVLAKAGLCSLTIIVEDTTRE